VNTYQNIKPFRVYFKRYSIVVCGSLFSDPTHQFLDPTQPNPLAQSNPLKWPNPLELGQTRPIEKFNLLAQPDPVQLKN